MAKINPKDDTILAQLVGVKNLKISGAVRLEFDVPQSEVDKVSKLLGQIPGMFRILLIKTEGE